MNNKPVEPIYLLKDGSLYDIKYIGAYAFPLSFADVLAKGERFSLLIDDSYFYYVYVGKISVNAKKVRPMIANYLQSIVPKELVNNFAFNSYKGDYVALLYTDEFNETLNNNVGFFCTARAISTIFCEMYAQYDSFIYTDGVKTYEKADNDIKPLAVAPAGALSAKDMQDELTSLKGELHINGVKKARDSVNGVKLAAIVVAVCYLLFVSALAIQVKSASGAVAKSANTLQKYYEDAGVASSADPYGMLLSKGRANSLVQFKVLDIMDDIGKSVPNNISVDGITVNDRLVRIEGLAANFNEVEALKTALETSLKKVVTVEESRQTNDKVKYTMRFLP